MSRATISPLGARAWLALALLAVGGCATRQPSSVYDHLVGRGERPIDVGGRNVDPDLAPYAAELRRRGAEAGPRPKVAASTQAEMIDPQLRDRLEALRTTPSSAAHRDVALEYRRLGILDNAYEHLSVAIHLDSHDASAYDQRARVWRAWGMPGLGVGDARRAVALAPQSAPAWNTLGLVLEESGEGGEAARSYLQALTVEDTAAYAWLNLCRLWTGHGNAFAAHACREAIRVEPASAPARANLQRAEQLPVAARTFQTPASLLSQLATKNDRTTPSKSVTP